MDIQSWTWLIVGLSLPSTLVLPLPHVLEVPPVFMSRAMARAGSFQRHGHWGRLDECRFFILAGIISFTGYTGSVYLIGWTGGYVLLALLLAPYLRKFGKFTVPDFVGDRYYSDVARLVAVFCAIFVSFTYVAGQMRGVGVVRFLEVEINTGVIIGMVLVFIYAT